MRLRRQFGRAVAGVAAVAPLCGLAVAGIAVTAPRSASHPSAGPAIAITPEISILPSATKPRLTPDGPGISPDGTFIDGYHPSQIRAAYFLNPLLKKGINGKGRRSSSSTLRLADDQADLAASTARSSCAPRPR